MADGLIYNFGAQRNEDYFRVWRFRAKGETAGLDLSGYDFAMHLNTSAGLPGDPILSINEVANGNGSVIDVTDAAAGLVSIFISRNDIAALPGRSADIIPFAYNFIATSDGGRRVDVRGQFIVEPGV